MAFNGIYRNFLAPGKDTPIQSPEVLIFSLNLPSFKHISANVDSQKMDPVRTKMIFRYR